MIKTPAPHIVLDPFPALKPGQNLASAIAGVLTALDLPLQDSDILVVAATVVSTAENRARRLPLDPDASAKALREALTAATGPEPAIVIAQFPTRSDPDRAPTPLGSAGIEQDSLLAELTATAAQLIFTPSGHPASAVVLRGATFDRA